MFAKKTRMYELASAKLRGVLGKPGLSLLDLGQVRVGVLPACQEIPVSLNCLRRIAGHCVRPGKSVESVAALGPLFQGLLKGLASFVPLMGSQVGLAQAFLFRTVKMRWFGVAQLLLFLDGLLKELERPPRLLPEGFLILARRSSDIVPSRFSTAVGSSSLRLLGSCLYPCPCLHHPSPRGLDASSRQSMASSASDC